MKHTMCTVEDLYESFRGKLKALVVSRTGDASLADDIVQETFVKLAGFCARGGSCKYPKSLLFRAALNLVADHFRSSAEARTMEALMHEHEEVPQPSDVNHTKECIECFLPLIDQLPERYREAVRLADIQQMPHTDVANRMGISVSGIKSRVQRGRAMLRDMLLRMCEIEHDRRGNIVRCAPRQ